jgi:diketogulonate reductase-like aldo/keto reductase
LLILTICNTVEIPKATAKERIQANINVFDFEISDEDMKALDSMNKNYHCTWDPTNVY